MDDNNKINIVFRYNGNNYFVESKKNELLSSIFTKFTILTKEYDKDFTFTYNNFSSLPLNPMKELREEIKFNNENNIYLIDVLARKNITGGGYSFKFTDLSKQITEELALSTRTSSAPSYTIVSRGINIFGICKNKKCNAYKKEVVVPLQKAKDFNLIKSRDNLECPLCEVPITPKTIGFHLCEYIIKGTKFENRVTESFEFKGKATNKNSIQYYNPEKNGETLIVELIIEVTKFL